uniref:Silk serpin 2 n=1 Tax=Arachnocampa richardsae TaxID=270896 RepID=S4TJ40_9DIPT|nr:silk serpin 2 [Arachnocampa richardsae]
MIVKNIVFIPFLLLITGINVNADFKITDSVFDFSVATFQLANKNNANFIMSPVSAQLILALTYDGASGATADAMNIGLDLVGQTQAQATNDFSALISSLMQLSGNTTLNIANRIYLNNTFQIAPAFQADASQLQASVATIDFADASNAANAINAWASEETNGNIQGVVQANQFNSNTAMVLVNAINFEGVWKFQFDPKSTYASSFYTDLKTSQQILMMNNQASFNYGSIPQLDATALQMIYMDPTVSMLLLLPNARDGLSNMVENLLGKLVLKHN